MISYDLLLELMTAIRAGRWEKFKESAEAVATANDTQDKFWSASVVAEALSAMGYAEFAFDDTLAWSVPSPLLITPTSVSATLCLLTGGRTSKILDSLRKEAAELGIKVACRQAQYAPSTVVLTAPAEEQLIQLAGKVGIALEQAVVDKLAQCLPSLASSMEVAPEEAPPSGYRVERFSLASLKWSPAERIEGDGLFRFKTYRPEHRYIRTGRSLKVSRAVGVYAALRQRQQPVIHYHAHLQELTVAPQARLPTLYARTLSLCIGGLPAFDPSRYVHTYSPVPPHIADAVMRGLEQKKES